MKSLDVLDVVVRYDGGSRRSPFRLVYTRGFEISAFAPGDERYVSATARQSPSTCVQRAFEQSFEF